MKQCDRLIEDAILLRLVRSVLTEDCVLCDIAVTSIGPHSGGSGAWHIDSPLTQMSEPLPDIPFAVQNVWMLDDFSERNGATHVVPGSHLTHKHPPWGYEPIDDKIFLTAPAGSMAMWLSHTWYRSKENFMDEPRRAILSYYVHTWVRPFSDYIMSMPDEIAQTYSPLARYLMGFSAYAPIRG